MHVELEGSLVPERVELEETEREMLRMYEEQHLARRYSSAYSTPTGIPPSVLLQELVVGEIKSARRRVGRAAESRGVEDWEDSDFEVLGRPSTSYVAALDEQRAAGPEPHEEWDLLERDDERPKVIRPSYALVVSIQ